MKQSIITLLLVALSIFSAGQEYTLPFDPSTHKVNYTDVVEAQGAARKALYENGKKWILTKNSSTNPYSVSFDNEADGTVTGKGTFMLSGDRRNYVVRFTINIETKEGKYRYSFTDFIIQYQTEAEYHSGGYGMWRHTTHTDAQNLEYGLETFYPSRLEGRKPSIKWYEEINKKSFQQIDQTMQSLVGSLKQAMIVRKDW
ncbi:MAG: hypothetical protein BGO69_17070 [Bacteroidetes bacterium 46-16]|nr:MAG: hypothetical protein BGO69_17070 [Bacteroidetes bacterium 46-16]